jgi:DNA-binding beta-propeller fold protein YncE
LAQPRVRPLRHDCSTRSDARPIRLASLLAVGLALVWAALGAGAADASLGELTFIGCTGVLSGCPGSPNGVIGQPRGIVVSPDGNEVYTADEGANAIDVFDRSALTGALTWASCIGDNPGCTATKPATAIDQPFAIAISPDGRDVYAVSVQANTVDEFSREPATGALKYTGCAGQLAECSPKTTAIESPTSIALSPDGTSVYVVDNEGAVVDLQRNTETGALSFNTCIGETAACTGMGGEILYAAEGLAISPNGSSVYVGAEGGTLDTFSREAATGDLKYDGECVGRNFHCTEPKPNRNLVSEPLSLAMSPDGQNLYAGNFNTGIVDVFARNTTTGALTLTSCNGKFLGETSDCTLTPEPDPEGPLNIAISPDGKDLYVASDFEIGEYARALPGGALTFVGCVGEREKLCTTTEPSEAIEFPLSIALSPDGESLYSGDELAEVVNEFGRSSPPVCSDLRASTAYQTPATLTLECGDTDGEPVTIAIASEPAHGTLGPLNPAGQVTYTPDAGYSGPDSFTFTATNGEGTSAPATASISVGTPSSPNNNPPPNENTGGGSQQPTSTAGVASFSSSATPGIATVPAAVEELLLGCSKRSLVLNDVVIHGSRVKLEGSAAKSLDGKRVKIVFDGDQRVATALVAANGQFSTTAPLPPASLRDGNDARYQAESGSQRSLDLKLTRRLTLEPPEVSGHTVTLVGQVLAPLTEPVARITVQQQLECGRTTVVSHVTPSSSGRFRITVTVPAAAKAGVYRLISSVRENTHSTRGFATYSLPLPAAFG